MPYRRRKTDKIQPIITSTLDEELVDKIISEHDYFINVTPGPVTITHTIGLTASAYPELIAVLDTPNAVNVVNNIAKSLIRSAEFREVALKSNAIFITLTDFYIIVNGVENSLRVKLSKINHYDTILTREFIAPEVYKRYRGTENYLLIELPDPNNRLPGETDYIGPQQTVEGNVKNILDIEKESGIRILH